MLVLALLVSAVCGFIHRKEMHYAVLVSGSNGYMNYRHQSDVCHAYHVMLEGGMPAKNIIVMSVDDAASSEENPFPGKLFNKNNHEGEAVDVRKGCVIDYKGTSVTPDNFLHVLTGNAEALADVEGYGRVLKSTKRDNVFINFVDHGATGLIAFGTKELHAKDLNKALKQMHRSKMYNKLVFYLESCESGSMFENYLPNDINIYALSAANSKESSWATYCAPNDDWVKVDGRKTHLKTCLGDLFSVNWMEETDHEHNSDVLNLTISEQYAYTKRTTNKSHVMQWGDKDFVDEGVDAFEGNEKDLTLESYERKQEHGDHQHHIDRINNDAVDSRDVTLQILYSKYLATKVGTDERKLSWTALQNELNMRDFYDTLFAEFGAQFRVDLEAEFVALGDDETDCYKKSISHFKDTCAVEDSNDYVMHHYTNFYSACSQGVPVHEIATSVEALC